MSDLPYGPLGFPNVRAWGMAPPINVQDDLEASATPMAVDPTVRPKRKKAPATDQGVAAFDAVFQDVGGDYDQAIATFAFDLVDAGVSPERAQQAALARAKQHQSLSRDPNIFFEEMGTPLPTSRQPKEPQGGASQPVPFGAMPDADPRTTRAERLAGVDATAAKWERQKAAYDRATGLGAPDAISGEEGPYQGAGRPGYDRTFTPAELAAQRGDTEEQAPAGYTLPGPRTLDGKPVRPARPLQTAEQASAYRERGTDPATGRRQKSQYDLDMEARGYTAVVLDNGTVGYYTTYAPATDEPTGRGAIGRAGDRPDLRNARVPGTESPRYEPREMLTPTGERVQVWAPTQAADEYTKQQRNTAMRGRLADRAGLDAPSVAGLSDDQLREQVRAKRTQEKQARADAWRAQSMLAGGQPTGGPRGTKAVTNAFSILTPEQQQDVISTRMRFPGRDGGRSDEWDRRLDIMRLQMENDRSEREKDRALTREQRQSATEADERRFAEERARREQEWRERSAQFDRDFALRQEQLTREAEANRQRHEQGMAGVSAQIEALRQRGAQGDAEMELKRAEAQRVADALQAAERAKRVAAESLRYGPGVEELMSGNYGTPGAQEALANIAAESDQSWTGFYHSDARRLDAELARLGITDPEARRQLVEQYGLGGMSSGSGGGRSGVISGLVNWMSGDYR